MDRAVSVLAAFRATMDRHRVAAYRAVATSAVREAQNRDLFVNRVATATQLDLEVVSGAEEARLLAIAVQRGVELGKRSALLVDIGGGSVEMAVVQKGQTLLSQSHRLGAVRLYELFCEGSRSADEKGALLEEYLDRMLKDAMREIRKIRPEVLLAVGGNAETLARIAGEEDDDGARGPRGVRFGGGRGHRAIVGIDAGRAGAEVRPAPRSRRHDRAGRNAPQLSAAAPRSPGLPLAASGDPRGDPRRAGRPGGRPRRSQERGARRSSRRPSASANITITTRRTRSRCASSHSRSSTRSRAEHRLDARDRVLLGIAATLHDIGEFVGYAHHHKHGFYLISNAELGGPRRRRCGSWRSRCVSTGAHTRASAIPSSRCSRARIAGGSRGSRRSSAWPTRSTASTGKRWHRSRWPAASASFAASARARGLRARALGPRQQSGALQGSIRNGRVARCQRNEARGAPGASVSPGNTARPRKHREPRNERGAGGLRARLLSQSGARVDRGSIGACWRRRPMTAIRSSSG